jgi:hypothetical protein
MCYGETVARAVAEGTKVRVNIQLKHGCLLIPPGLYDVCTHCMGCGLLNSILCQHCGGVGITPMGVETCASMS